MNDAVFISDLHLHPNESLIKERFERFIVWASTNTRSVYILGDFFHVWAGDDGLDSWSAGIADQLAWLAGFGVTIYFMVGNRDFLLGEQFAQRAKMKLLSEPTVIHVNKQPVLLVHGDRYCTLDKGHQWLRRITRNAIFSKLFLQLPQKLRTKIVHGVRQKSQNSRAKPMSTMDIVPEVMIAHMQECNVTTVIHGHIHKPQHRLYPNVPGSKSRCLSAGFSDNVVAPSYQQYVLSDWDDNPLLLCYNEPLGFYFEPLSQGIMYAKS